MEPIVTLIATRKVDGKWEGACISNGRFLKAFVDKDLYKAVSARMAGLLTSDKEDETEVTIEIRIVPPQPAPPEEKKIEDK